MTGEAIDPGVIELAGRPSARATAAFFRLPAMSELLEGRTASG